MQLPIELRLKIRHWIKKYGKILFFIIIVWISIFIINKFLGDYQAEQVPNTTKTPQVAVMSTNEKVSKKVQTSAEEFIESYVDACNQGKYQKAFAMISENCRKYEFNDDVEKFAKYVLEKMPTPKKYSIQSYSNTQGYYIYEVKYFDDMLATGLTNSEYNFTTEKMVLKKNSKGSFDIAVGNFIEYKDINSVAENDYLKIDVKNCMVRYSTQTYEVKLTNRTDYTIVVADNYVEDEISLALSGEYRGTESGKTIVLPPEGSLTVKLGFMKFVDDNDEAQSLLFSNIRVLEEYAGVTSSNDVKKAEIEKAIDKFSMNVPVKK